MNRENKHEGTDDVGGDEFRREGDQLAKGHHEAASAGSTLAEKTGATPVDATSSSNDKSGTGMLDVEHLATHKPVPSKASEFSKWKWLAQIGGNTAGVVIACGVVLFLIGLTQRVGWVVVDEDSGVTKDGGATAKISDASKRYICPMMCTPPSTEPGRCPVCGMELVEAAASGGGDGVSVTIEVSARRLAGIQTATAKLGEMSRTIRTIGSIDFDGSHLATISAYVDGRLEKMFADYVGVKVQEGDDLALIYSPQLYSAQTEYVASLDDRAVSRFMAAENDMRAIARENLSELGMTAEQIESLTASRKPQARSRIVSPQSGTVIEKNAVEGEYVKTGQQLFKIADLSSVWLMLDLFPDDAARVRFGQQVEAEIQSMPGEVFAGRVAFIDPTVNQRTRTVRVRVEVLNLDGNLRPGDYAAARISVPAIPMELIYDPAISGKYVSPMHPQIIRDRPGKCPLCNMDLVPTTELGYSAGPIEDQLVITVPRDAVLLTGDNAVIYVETDPGRFEIRRVVLGPMNDTEAVILEGIAGGEIVATAGNFLIDSQMQLAGNPSLLDPTRAVRFAPGPLALPSDRAQILFDEAGEALDQAFVAYFDIQRDMASDLAPTAVQVNTLIAELARLEMFNEVPDNAQRQIAIARHSAERMTGSLEAARKANRTLSHALLRTAVYARGPRTSASLSHYYCPMVPGGGGDWMQPGGELANPYWGSEMLRCGELVRNMATENESPVSNPPERN